MHARLTGLAATQGGVFTAQQARACGYSGREIQARCTSRKWIALRRGIYTTALTQQACSPDDVAIHRLGVAAALLALGHGAVASHSSAAVLLGVAQLRQPGTTVTLTVDHAGSARAYREVLVHRAGLPGHHIRPGAHRSTSPARTVVDLARTASFREAVVAADSALHRRLASMTELQQVLADCSGWPGGRRAARVVQFASPAAEAASESLARVVFAEQGLPQPELQAEIRDGDGRIGFVDFLFRANATIGEVDGKVKYAARPGEPDPGDVLWQEKRREDRLREAGYEVVRVTWHQLAHLAPETGHRFRAAFARAQSRRAG